MMIKKELRYGLGRATRKKTKEGGEKMEEERRKGKRINKEEKGDKKK